MQNLLRKSSWLRPGRAHLIGVLISFGLVLSGCSMFDEWMPETPEPKKAKATPAATPEDGGSNKREQLRSYYEKQARPKKSSDAYANDPIVRCRVDASDEYMRQSDCHLRGGYPAD